MLAIKGFDMPKRCIECPFQDGPFCMATYSQRQINWMVAIKRRQKWCPLVEVKDEEGEDDG